MGLDMYLTSYEPGLPGETAKKQILLGQWRKFNNLHGFIVDKLKHRPDVNCEEIELDMHDTLAIMTVLNKVWKILEEDRPDLMKKDPVDWDPSETFSEKATEEINKIFPSAEGFFWGTGNITPWFAANVKNSIEIFNQANKLQMEGQPIYYDCWW